METSELIAAAIAVIAIVTTAKAAYGYGYKVGGNTERLRSEDRSVESLIQHENKRRPKAAKNRRKAQRKAVRA